MTIKDILNSLADGIDPTTGEVFDIAVFGQWDVYNAYRRLKEVVSVEHKKVSKAGSYRRLCEQYPDHIILIKAGYFYSAYSECAEVLAQVTGYKLAFLSGHTPTTGCPDLCSIAEKLHAANISYIAFNNGEIEDRFDGKNPFI